MTKTLRKKNRKLLDEVKLNPCCVCGASESDPAHIKSKGSGGDDAWDNLLNLCRDCHIKQHKLGWFRFAGARPEAMSALQMRGWEFVEEFVEEFGVWKLRRAHE